MKFFFQFFFLAISCQLANAQLKATVVCPAFLVDVLDGNVSKIVFPKSTIGQIQIAFPCFTEAIEDTASSKCAGVFYKDKDINFYTSRNYIEIGANYKGKMNPPLIGAARGSLFATLGYPKIKDVTWDAFQMAYGTLVVYYDNAGKINKLQISSKTTETLKLCE